MRRHSDSLTWGCVLRQSRFLKALRKLQKATPPSSHQDTTLTGTQNSTCVCVSICASTHWCVSVWLYAVSGGHAVELQQPGSGKRCVHHRELWIRLHTCGHGSPLHQGAVQGYAHTEKSPLLPPLTLMCSGPLTLSINDLFIIIISFCAKTWCMCVHPQARWPPWRASWLSAQEMKYVATLPISPTFLLIFPISVHSFLIFMWYHIFFSLSQRVLFFPFLLVYVHLPHSFHALFTFSSTFSPFVCLSSSYQGGCIHDGTWQSAIYGFSDGHKLQSLRRKFNHKPLPTVGSKLKRRYVE